MDVLVTDEAHRIRDVSSNRFTPANKKSGLKQLEELIAAARVSVFFIDDHQVVRPGEIGSVAYIREYAEKHKCAVCESELETQFRCNGSDAFVRWINTMLGIDDRPRFEWNDHDAFDFRIFQSPEALENAIKDKVQAGVTGPRSRRLRDPRRRQRRNQRRATGCFVTVECDCPTVDLDCRITFDNETISMSGPRARAFVTHPSDGTTHCF